MEAKNLEKEYFKQNKEFIEMQNNNFLLAIKEIEKERNEKIENLVFSDIESDLEKKLPLMSKKFQEFLFHFFEKVDLEDKEVEEIVNKEVEFNILKSDYLDNKNNLYEFIKTANSFWVWNEFNNNSTDLEDFSEEDDSKKNYLKNYKEYIWQKLLLTEKEIEDSKIEEIDLRMSESLTLAKNHVFHVMRNFNWDAKKFKSVYFDQIHEVKNIFSLMKFYLWLEKKKWEILKKIKNWESEENFKFALNQIKIWKFEIQRIFALNSLYIDRNSTLNHKHVEEEKDFLIWKIKDIASEDSRKSFLDNSTNADNELYNYTRKKDIFWKRDENWKYLISETEKNWYNKITLDSYEIEWRFRKYDKKTVKIKIYHLWNRTSKNSFSTVEKFLRKWFSSFNEILDHKWFIFVVDNYEKEWKNLLKILENEFWTLRTSWTEEPVFMSENWNKNSNSEYNSLKWIIKFSYKWKKINWFFKDLEKIPWIRKMWKIFSTIRDLKNKFFNKKYFIETEIQIFDLENYLKAEVDEISPAYHWNYKEYQQISNIPLYFPNNIYWEENLKNVIKKSLNKIKK